MYEHEKWDQESTFATRKHNVEILTTRKYTLLVLYCNRYSAFRYYACTVDTLHVNYILNFQSTITLISYILYTQYYTPDTRT